MVIWHAIDFIFLFPIIKDDAKLDFYDTLVKKRFSASKKVIEMAIKSIQISYARIENKAALHLMDKAKDIMRKALSLYDRGIEVLKPN